MRLHPRVAYQGLYPRPQDRIVLVQSLPRLVPFRDGEYHAVIPVLDWDHRLPSKTLVLRIYAYYDALSLAAGEEAFDSRLEEIANRDKFPEFDVPDFGDLPASEAYQAEVSEAGVVLRCWLMSAWRRDVSDDVATTAVEVARSSQEFARIAATAPPGAADRPHSLGGLEAVAWTPPCESGCPTWTVDVWYLLQFDGCIGTGRSLLVDPAKGQVIAVRDFSVRTS